MCLKLFDADLVQVGSAELALVIKLVSLINIQKQYENSVPYCKSDGAKIFFASNF